MDLAPEIATAASGAIARGWDDTGAALGRQHLFYVLA